MHKKYIEWRVYIAIILTGMTFLFVSCGPVQPRVSPSDVANFLPSRTTIFADGSGTNTFLLIIPDRPDCQLVPLESTLDGLKSAFGQMTYHHYTQNGNKGFEITFPFTGFEQIPEQIEKFQQAIVNTAIEASPTPIPMPDTVTPLPPIPYNVYYDPKIFSLDVKPVQTTLTGQKWEVDIVLNPFRLSGGPSSSDSSQTCKTSRMVYEITMPGEVTSFSPPMVQVTDSPELKQFSKVEVIPPSTVRWTLETAEAETWLQSQQQAVYDDITWLTATPTTQQQQEIVDKLNKFSARPGYTLIVKSSTPGSVFKFITIVLAPLVALIGGLIGILTAFAKLRQNKKRIETES